VRRLRTAPIDEAEASGPSSPITCSQTGNSVVVSNGRYRATASTEEPLVVDALINGKQASAWSAAIDSSSAMRS